MFRGEDGARTALDWSELSRQVTQVAEALVELGVREGDRVALFLPMCPAVAVASHACAHIGAVQVPVFSGFAAPAIAARLEDSEAKAVICADWSYRRGKRIDDAGDARTRRTTRGASTCSRGAARAAGPSS